MNYKLTRTALVLLALLSTINGQLSTASAQGTAFTYQGRLNDGANPANGIYDLRFAIYDSLAGGTQQGVSVTNASTSVSNGLFTVTLDFGNQFPGAARWLELAVRTNGAASFYTLSPRQVLTPAPYAITAGNVISGGLAAGTYGSAVTFSNSGNSFNGAFSGNGGGLTNVNAGSLGGLAAASFWQLGGNSVAPGQFVGSLNNQPLELRANGIRGLRLEPTVNTTSDSNIVNVIGGSPANFVMAGVYGATISGGGGQAYNGFSAANSVASDLSVVGGGGANQVQSNAFASTVSGGFDNVIQSGASPSTISGGANNVIQQGATYSSIAGGGLNTITISNLGSCIGGGFQNVIQGGGGNSVIAGGKANQIQTNAAFCAVGGGVQNTMGAGIYYSTIGGGFANSIETNAWSSSISGGFNNRIGTNASESTISGGGGNIIQANAGFSSISGGAGNIIGANDDYSVIGGGQGNVTGGYWATTGGGYENGSYGQSATVAGGYQNTALATNSTVSGGKLNFILNYSDYSNIGGGNANEIKGYAIDCVIGGGDYNTIVGPNYGSTIGGGEYNTNYNNTYLVGVYGDGTIAGGFNNLTDGDLATVGGGNYNSASSDYATVSGGNINTSSGYASTVPGGEYNTASGATAFAAGFKAQASNNGTFVWSDESSQAYFTTTAPNQFLVRAAGGVGIGLNNPTAALHVASGGDYTMPQAQLTQQNSGDSCRLRLNVSGYNFWEMDVGSGSSPQLQFWYGGASGPRMSIDTSGNVYAASFNPSSDRNLKENFSAVSPREVLDKVAALPITRWNFKQDTASEHLGPMAQDFRAAFGLGLDDKHIATVDEGGVALAAIQGLNQKLEQKDAEIQELKQAVAELKKLVQSLAERK